MRSKLSVLVVASCSVPLAATGCSSDLRAGETDTAISTFGNCGLGNDVLAAEVVTTGSIPQLTALERAQIIAAVQESAHTDVTTIEEAFDRVDDHEINLIVLHDDATNQFYVEAEFGAGGNSYGAIFYWDTAVKAAAIHDGFQEECGPVTFNYGQGDTAAACAGFLDYTNTASFAELDVYLPGNVAQAIVDARTVAPFTSVASVAAVSGVAELRLQQLLSAARTAGLVGASCSGIYDQVATSVDQAAAIVALVNEASADELRGILAQLIDETVVANLVSARPFATIDAVSTTSRVGTATFRRLRNVATFRNPYEELVGAVNAINHPDAQLRLDTHFDWVALVSDAGEFSTMECFGIPASQLPAGATIRPNLANGAEVVAAASEGVAIANSFGELTVDPAPGLTDLAFRTAGHRFFGCNIAFDPNPFQHDTQTFFVDTATGLSLLITFHHVE